MLVEAESGVRPHKPGLHRGREGPRAVSLSLRGTSRHLVWTPSPTGREHLPWGLPVLPPVVLGAGSPGMWAVRVRKVCSQLNPPGASLTRM